LSRSSRGLALRLGFFTFTCMSIGWFVFVLHVNDVITLQVCTFSLILKNAASLLANKDSLKVEADTRLEELIKYVYS
jgi:hypothetical protein